MKHIFYIAVFVLSVTLLKAQVSERIKVNQVGYYVNGPKLAVVTEASATTFEIQETNGTVVYTGNLGSTQNWSKSGENVKTIDFTDFKNEGTFVINIAGTGKSYEFKISNDALKEVARKSVRYFYYNRASQAIQEPYAEGYARAGGHWDTQVKVCEDANYPGGSANGTILSSPGGWYDAGDYNKYMQTAGISTYTLLAAYEHYPAFVESFNLNIPESNNNIPDLIDECLWELNWLLTLQDIDGGVFAKVTDQSFTAFTLPDVNQGTGGTRYICRKNTPSTVQFAALMAAAYRILEPFEANLPAGKRTAFLDAAKKAWTWAGKYPSVAANGCGCSITTGGYGDSNPNDEWIWAACEMYLATGDISYYNARRSNILGLSYVSVPSWAGGQEVLGVISLLVNKNKLSGNALSDVPVLQGLLIGAADYLLDKFNNCPYKIIKSEFWDWGSNGDAGNQSFIILSANAVQPNPDYIKAGLSNLDYILGKNPVAYSMFTGEGDKRCTYTHHRISGGDGIYEPVPGMVLGGPYQNVTNFKQSGFSSGTEEYAMTEVTINWNAPVAYTAIAVQALYETNCQKPDMGADISLCSSTLPITLNSGITEGNFTWYKNGSVINGASGASLVLNNQADAVGIFTVENSFNNCQTTDEIEISNTMPTPDLGNDKPLSGASLVLDAGISGIGYIYKWYKNNVLITGESQQTVTVSDVNSTYKVEVSTATCAATSDEIYISTPPSFTFTSKTITIDGVKDNSFVNEYPIETLLLGTPDISNLSGTWTGLWDNTNIYLFISVTDQALYNDSDAAWYNDDCVEVFFDGANNKATTYDNNDFQLGFIWDRTAYVQGGSNLSNVENVVFKIVQTTIGYNIEIQIPWTSINTIPTVGKTIGFDIGINDDDNGTTRENKISWHQTADNGWNNPSVLGEIVLLDKPADVEITQTTSLSTGWNLISIYVSPLDKSIATVFPNATIVKTDNAYWNKNQPTNLNSISEIIPGQGYMIYNSKSEDITITGTEIQNIWDLKSGWNLAGSTYTQSETLQNAFGIELQNIKTIKDFEKYYSQDGTGTLQNIEPGKAYYIYKQ